MHSNTVALDSLPPILLTFSDLLLLFLFFLSTKFLVPCVLLIFPLNETLILPFCLLPNWEPRGRRGISVLAWLNQNTTWSKTVSPLTFKVRSALVGLIRCGWKHRWVKWPMSQAISRKANSYSLMYPPPSSLTIPRRSRVSQQIGHLLREGRIRAHKGQVSSPNNPLVMAW